MVGTLHVLSPAPTAGSLREAAHHVRRSCWLVWASPSLPSEHQESAALTQPCPVTTTRSAREQINHHNHKTDSFLDFFFWYLVIFNICDSVYVLQCDWLVFYCLAEFQFCIHLLSFYSVYCNEIKRAEGATEREREPSIEMWEDVARSNVDYLLLWQWVWILQAAGLLLFLNKASFFSRWSVDEDTHSWN